MSKESTQLKKHRGTKHVMEDRPVCKKVQARHGGPACMQGGPGLTRGYRQPASSSCTGQRTPATGKQLMHRSKDTGNRQSSS